MNGMVESAAAPAQVGQSSVTRRRMRVMLLFVVPVFALIVVAGVYLAGGRYVETDDAYVKADVVPISPQVAGTIKEVLVQDNQAVSAGQALFRIDPANFELAVAKAQAKLAQVRSDLAALKASYGEKQAEIAVARTRYAYAQKERQREADLVAKNFVSASRYDDAAQSAELSREQVGTLEEDLKRIAAALGGDAAAPVERHPSYLAALAELRQAEIDLGRTEVRASLAGTVSNRPKPGQYVAAGSTTMALVVSNSIWVEANFTETDLTHVHPGEPANIRVDTFPDIEWKGSVESLSPATGAEFSVIPAQNVTGNWVKITQRVPVRIKLDLRPGMPALRAGLSSIVRIDTGHRRRLFGLSL